jgi:hypothetical protein
MLSHRIRYEIILYWSEEDQAFIAERARSPRAAARFEAEVHSQLDLEQLNPESFAA